MDRIQDILAEKGRSLMAISRWATVHTGAVLMTEHKIGSLLVLDQGQLIGILTERDILEKVVAEQQLPGNVCVDDVMTRDVPCCGPHTSLEEARSVMKNRRVRHLPVVDDTGTVIGVVSIGDLNAYQVMHQETTIYLLQEYIQGHA